MNEILKKRIDNKAVGIGLEFRDSMVSRGSKRDVAEAIAILTQTAAHMMAEWMLDHMWISVEKALPEEEKKVLVTHQYGCQVAAFYKDGAHSYWGVAKECPIGASITHWMPIPELKGG